MYNIMMTEMREFNLCNLDVFILIKENMKH